MCHCRLSGGQSGSRHYPGDRRQVGHSAPSAGPPPDSTLAHRPPTPDSRLAGRSRLSPSVAASLIVPSRAAGRLSVAPPSVNERHHPHLTSQLSPTRRQSVRCGRRSPGGGGRGQRHGQISPLTRCRSERRRHPSALPCPALSCPVLPCPALSCPVLSCPVTLGDDCPALPCPALLSPVLPYLSLPCYT